MDPFVDPDGYAWHDKKRSVMFAYDSVWVVAEAIASLLRDGKTHHVTRGTELREAIRKVSIRGATGNVSFDEVGDDPGLTLSLSQIPTLTRTRIRTLTLTRRWATVRWRGQSLTCERAALARPWATGLLES